MKRFFKGKKEDGNGYGLTSGFNPDSAYTPQFGAPSMMPPGQSPGGGFGQPSMMPPGANPRSPGFGGPSMMPPGRGGPGGQGNGQGFGAPSMMPPGRGGPVGQGGGPGFGAPSMMPPGRGGPGAPGGGQGFGAPTMLPPGRGGPGSPGGGQGFGAPSMMPPRNGGPGNAYNGQAGGYNDSDSDSDYEDYGSFRAPGSNFNPYGSNVPPPRSGGGFYNTYESTSDDDDDDYDDSDSSYYENQNQYSRGETGDYAGYEDDDEDYYDGETYEGDSYYDDDDEEQYDDYSYESPGGFGSALVQEALAGLKPRSPGPGAPMSSREGFGGATSTKIQNIRAQGLNHVSFNFETGKTKTQEKNPPDWAKKAKKKGRNNRRIGDLEKEKNGESGNEPEWKNIALKKGPRPMTTAYTPAMAAAQAKAYAKKNGKLPAPRKLNKVEGSKPKVKSRDPSWKNMQLKPGPRPMTTAYVPPQKAGSPKSKLKDHHNKNKDDSPPKAPGTKPVLKSHNGDDKKGKGDGCYLMYEKSKGGTLYAQWTSKGISTSSALGYFKPGSPAPRFKYKQNDGRIDLLGGTDNKKKYFEAWTYFFSMAREMDAKISILDRTKESGFSMDIYTLDTHGKVKQVKPGKSCDTSKIEYVAAVPHASKAFEGVKDKVEKKFFMNTAEKSGVCLELTA